MSNTPNYDLYLTDNDDISFLEWRKKINGTEDSNMMKIDAALKELAETPGTPGKDGKDFTYDDFTPEQLAALKGADGTPGIVISETQPTSEEHPVWLDPNGDDADGVSLGLTGATVGQIAKISAIDDNGVPTAWEAVDMPAGGGSEEWELLKHILIPEGAAETNVLTINTDENGNAFSCKKVRLMSEFPPYTGESTIPNFSFTEVNGITGGSQSPLCYTSGHPTPNNSRTVTGMLEIDLSMPEYEVDRVARFGGVGGRPSNVLYYGKRRLNNAESIVSIGGAGMLIYPGCEFYLYGVRA